MEFKPAPKGARENAAYRKAVLARCENDPDAQSAFWWRCSQSVIYWLDTFCYTKDAKNHKHCPHRPFVSYEYQEKTALQICDAVGEHNLIAEKSRQMGFTWLVCAIFVWFWLFRPGLAFLMGSRKQELVDSPTDDSNSLFYKIDYIIARLPAWMIPAFTRTERRIANEENGTVITGESTNENFGRGGTYTAIACDEFSAIDNGYEILAAVGDATNCALLFGTSQGASGAYFDTLERMKRESPDRVIRWLWTDHPEKRKGLYTSHENEHGEYILEKLAPESEYPPNYPFKLDGKLRSLAYDAREKDCPSKKIMEREWEIKYAASSDQWFDQEIIEKLKAKCRSPRTEGEILFDPDWRKPRWHKRAGGTVKLWFEWAKDGNGTTIVGVVPKDWTDIVAGCDISMGTAGEHSSNSSASFFRRSTGEKIAEFTTNTMSPAEFCRHVLALCRWFNDAFLNWEKNGGVGAVFTKTVAEEGYRNVYMSEDSEAKFITKKTFKPGWQSTKETKPILLTEYAEALLSGEFINYSKDALSECSEYVILPSGAVEHARARGTEEAAETGDNHGDRVIADAVCWRAARDMKKRTQAEKPEEKPLPLQSFGGRRKLFDSRQRDKRRVWGECAR